VALNSRGRAHARGPTRSNKRRTPRISRNRAPGSRAGPTPRADPIALRLCAEQVGQTGPRHRGRKRNQISRDGTGSRRRSPSPRLPVVAHVVDVRRAPYDNRGPVPALPDAVGGAARHLGGPAIAAAHRDEHRQIWPETGHSNLPYDDGGNGS
jgi:hypothetical protein